MFRKKDLTIETHEDSVYMKIWNEVSAANFKIVRIVEDVLVKREVINLYPTGPDKDLAQNDFETAQQFLLNAIADYDDLKRELFEYYKLNKDKLNKTIDWIPSTMTNSHTIVEIAYRNFLTK